jgi:hypothetical protein
MIRISPEVTRPDFAKLTQEELQQLYRISKQYEVKDYGNIAGEDRVTLLTILDAIKIRPEGGIPVEDTETILYKHARNMLYAGHSVLDIATVMPPPYDDPVKLQKFLKKKNPRLLLKQ